MAKNQPEVITDAVAENMPAASAGVSGIPPIMGESAVDVRFLNMHPAMWPLPAEREALKALLHRHSVLKGEVVRASFLLSHIKRAEVRALHEEKNAVDRDDRVHRAKRLAFYDYFRDAYGLEAGREAWYGDLLRDAFIDANEAVTALQKDYLPTQVGRNLVMISDVSTEQDPVRMFELIVHARRKLARNPSDVISQRIAFEASRQSRLAQLQFEGCLYGMSSESLKADMKKFVSTLEDKFFAPEKSERVFLEADLDRRNKYRVSGTPHRRQPHEVSRPPQPGFTRYQTHLDARVFLGKGGREIPIYFDNRTKVRLFWKLLSKSERDPRTLGDGCAAYFVFFNEEDLLEGVECIRRGAARYLGCVFGEASSISRAGVLDPGNAHSSNEYRAMKFNILLFGKVYELQLMLISDYINMTASHGPENHDLYKLRIYTRDLFPRVWPQSIYGLDWKDPVLARRLRHMVYSRIG